MEWAAPTEYQVLLDVIAGAVSSGALEATSNAVYKKPLDELPGKDWSMVEFRLLPRVGKFGAVVYKH